MTTETMTSKPANELLAEEIYTRWRNEDNYRLAPLHAEWVIRWLAAALSALIAREAAKVAREEGVAEMQARLDRLAKQHAELTQKYVAERAAAQAARSERDKLRNMKTCREKYAERAKDPGIEELELQLKRAEDCSIKLGKKLNDANAVAANLREENQRMARELVELRSLRVAETMATHKDIVRGNDGQ